MREGYERQYCEISTVLSRKCAAASALDGEKKQKLSEIQADLQESDSLIRRMDSEARSLQPSVKAGLLAKLSEYKSDLSDISCTPGVNIMGFYDTVVAPLGTPHTLTEARPGCIPPEGMVEILGQDKVDKIMHDYEGIKKHDLYVVKNYPCSDDDMNGQDMYKQDMDSCEFLDRGNDDMNKQDMYEENRDPCELPDRAERLRSMNMVHRHERNNVDLTIPTWT